MTRSHARTARLAGLLVAAVAFWLIPNIASFDRPLTVTPAIAQQGAGIGWTAASVSGPVRMRDGSSGLNFWPFNYWQQVHRDDLFVSAAEIETGPGGEVVLRRGEDSIRMTPNSRVELAASTANDLTRVQQTRGSVSFDVETREGRRFEVETPFLVAVVKGTQFTVTVGTDDANVVVSRGRVGISVVGRDSDRDVYSGQTARVVPGPNARVSVRVTQPSSPAHDRTAIGDGLTGGPPEWPNGDGRGRGNGGGNGGGIGPHKTLGDDKIAED